MKPLKYKEGKNKKMKMKFADIGVSVLFVVALAVIYFFWGCHLDLYVTILAGVVIAATGLTTYVQYKKMKELETKEDNDKTGQEK